MWISEFADKKSANNEGHLHYHLVMMAGLRTNNFSLSAEFETHSRPQIPKFSYSQRTGFIIVFHHVNTKESWASLLLNMTGFHTKSLKAVFLSNRKTLQNGLITISDIVYQQIFRISWGWVLIVKVLSIQYCN